MQADLSPGLTASPHLPTSDRPLQRLSVLDSHTAGEPTRLVLSGGPDLGSGAVARQLQRLQSGFPGFCSSIVCEPRGSSVVVGALLCPPLDPSSAAGVIFFNDVGYLGMCGHGSIGLVHSLAHLGRIAPGEHRIETPVGAIHATLHPDGAVTIANVPSYCLATDISVDLAEPAPAGSATRITGDIAWGGNWFFLVTTPPPLPLHAANAGELTRLSLTIRAALRAAGITGASGAPIDHIEWSAPAHDPANHSRNFVLCPGAAFDRSPCGTGTSAKLASLAARGLLGPGQPWRQEGILGTVFSARYQPGTPASAPAVPATILPEITGRAFVTAESTLLFDPADPFPAGIAFP